MKTTPLSKVFDISYGNSYSLQNLKKGATAFIARGSQNNGVADYVDRTDDKPFPPGCLTVSLGGSVLETFYQTQSFYTAYHIKVLTPNKDMTEKELLYYCMIIRANKYRYNYGRQANKTLQDIKVTHPDCLPDYVKNKSLPQKPTRLPVIKYEIELTDKHWMPFRLSSIFDIKKCKCNNASALLEKGDDIFYIGAKKSDNGIMSKVKHVEKLVTKGNCIVFIGDGQGSIGYHTYQPDNFIGSTTLTVGYNDKLNSYNALFLITLLDRRRPLFSFGRKYGKSIVEIIYN